MYDYYLKDILALYNKKKETKDVENLSVNLLHPTPGNLKAECINVYRERPNPDDDEILRLFFKATDKGYTKSIENISPDEFRQIQKILNRKIKTPGIKYVELLAWLIDFQPRPSTLYYQQRKPKPTFWPTLHQDPATGTSDLTTDKPESTITDSSLIIVNPDSTRVNPNVTTDDPVVTTGNPVPATGSSDSTTDESGAITDNLGCTTGNSSSTIGDTDSTTGDTDSTTSDTDSTTSDPNPPTGISNPKIDESDTVITDKPSSTNYNPAPTIDNTGSTTDNLNPTSGVPGPVTVNPDSTAKNSGPATVKLTPTIFTTRTIIIACSTFLLLILGGYFLFWRPNTVRSPIKPLLAQQCMYWTGDHYEPISCSEKINNPSVVPLNTHRLNRLRKITSPDTLTKNSVGRVWYTRISGKHEFFTDSGRHPIDTAKKLRPLTRYILANHVSYYRYLLIVLVWSICIIISIILCIIFIRSLKNRQNKTK